MQQTECLDHNKLTSAEDATFNNYNAPSTPDIAFMKSVNRNSLLYRTSMYRHLRYIDTHYGEQRVALYRGLIVHDKNCIAQSV